VDARKLAECQTVRGGFSAGWNCGEKGKVSREVSLAQGVCQIPGRNGSTKLPTKTPTMEGGFRTVEGFRSVSGEPPLINHPTRTTFPAVSVEFPEGNSR
jgi:hypothetical protein